MQTSEFFKQPLYDYFSKESVHFYIFSVFGAYGLGSDIRHT